MRPAASQHIRLARPSRDLERAQKFWVEGLGLEVLDRMGPDAEGGHALLMLGWPDAAWHLELVGDPSAVTAPSEEDLLVLYLGGQIDDNVIARLERAGGRRVGARNPYWDRWGSTFQDPDGYRLVLCVRDWGSD